MKKEKPARRSSGIITPEMTILDVISEYRETEAIFRGLEARTGTCICCQGLFLTLRTAAVRYGFDLETLLTELNALIADVRR